MARRVERNRRMGLQVLAATAGRGVATGAFLLSGLLLAGCTVSGPTPASLSSPRGTTIALESIDGLPRGQFQKLVKAITEEAEARQVAVVTRESTASYRARGYAAAHHHGKQTVVSWVWDVYDAENQRAIRISGEEKTSGTHGWSAADDVMLRRIARESVDQIAGFLANPAQPLPASTPATPESAVVMAEGAGSTATTQAALANTEFGPNAPSGRTAAQGARNQPVTRSTVAAYAETTSR